eukprot:TRINITY_DN22310_c0_g1_i1.p1 TRINITY_DN22310_c0_g1~~TRINITY_DN22310_c0_g1_i1.p1  ORF type:complete len:108 (-),score=14.99 TRINITY_DN22310_c0_g1_i1:80-403(-)
MFSLVDRNVRSDPGKFHKMYSGSTNVNGEARIGSRTSPDPVMVKIHCEYALHPLTAYDRTRFNVSSLMDTKYPASSAESHVKYKVPEGSNVYLTLAGVLAISSERTF